MDDNEYDRLLSQSVIVCELLAASANTTIVECIARATPVAVNRHPAIEEYLGPSYPMFFDDPARIPDLLSDELLRDTHSYLRDLQQQDWLQVSTFSEKVSEFVAVVAATT